MADVKKVSTFSNGWIAMKQIPILYNSAMVQDVIEGRKTKTRVIKHAVQTHVTT